MYVSVYVSVDGWMDGWMDVGVHICVRCFGMYRDEERRQGRRMREHDVGAAKKGTDMSIMVHSLHTYLPTYLPTSFFRHGYG